LASDLILILTEWELPRHATGNHGVPLFAGLVDKPASRRERV